MKFAWTVGVLLIGAFALAGCASGPLTIDVQAMGETVSVHYHLDPAGLLTVDTEGEFSTESATPEYHTQLDKQAMDRLRNVVYDSGFFLVTPSMPTGEPSGPMLRVDISLGLWENTMDVRGQRVYSLRKILDELDRRLPSKYKIRYQSVTGEKEPAFGSPAAEFMDAP